MVFFCLFLLPILFCLLLREEIIVYEFNWEENKYHKASIFCTSNEPFREYKQTSESLLYKRIFMSPVNVLVSILKFLTFDERGFWGKLWGFCSLVAVDVKTQINYQNDRHNSL